MDFIEYINNWTKSEVQQGRIMIGFGTLASVGFFFILNNENRIFHGSLIPLGLLILVLIGYGFYIIQSRPKHANASIEIYQKSRLEGIAHEKAKHINDNKAGKTLLRLYPLFVLISIIALYFISGPYYIGLAIGFALFFLAAFVIDYGFVSRSDAFIDFLDNLPQ